MKKIAAILLALMILTLSPSSLAHSHSSNHHRYKLCNVRTCAKKGTHKHHGVTYRAHYRGDGHSYHKSNHH